MACVLSAPQPTLTTMPPSFPPETDTYLKEAMLAIAQRDGFDRCYFDGGTTEAVMARTGLSREQVLKWAENARDRYGHCESMEIFLRLSQVDDQSVPVGRFFAVCIAPSAQLLGHMLLIPKARAGGQYVVTGQVGSWNESTKELRLFVEKEMTTTKMIMDSLTLAGAKQVQISSFHRNDPRPAQWALRSVTDLGARPGSRIVTLGALKTKLPPPATPAAAQNKDSVPGPSDGDTEMPDAQQQQLLVQTNANLAQTGVVSAETIARSGAEIAHLRHVQHQLKGQNGAKKRKENIPVRLALEIANERLRAEQERRQRAENMVDKLENESSKHAEERSSFLKLLLRNAQ